MTHNELHTQGVEQAIKNSFGYIYASICTECLEPWPCPTIQAIEKELK